MELRKVVKRFGDVEVVKSLDLSIEKGEFLTFLGPSGCGKTTTLRMIGGFEMPTSGEIYLDGREVSALPPYKRDVNTVFQSYALFPHMSVRQNVAYGLEQKRLPKAEIERKVTEVLAMVRMDTFAARKPRELSGGQQQRVAVARAIVNGPTVLLLDEPLGALDLKLRKEMQFELKSLQRKLGMTFVYVTHDQEEALTMSDRVAVMNGGRIEQIDAPVAIYNRPKTRFVADFIGETNLLAGEVHREGSSHAFSLGGARIPIEPDAVLESGRGISLSVRPEMVTVRKAEGHESEGVVLPGTVEETVFVGSVWKTVVRLKSGERVVATEPPATHGELEQGTSVVVGWNPKSAVVLEA
ncbi:ABC transporter ATP-binding protein [Polyangium sorediatum]|uniref:Spermidine/putrescine import ATP-binding protein PotA n=1 Tax=Polyangium sorediatum TaxID=889274 RepID=A0ABT6NM35_9BACT|nr:ABC transporter ATP-binding protein [Polyangium sorediatum]MDI1429389.1 ABC transporter ATP-binding protein [Polyangium sorediatum]